MGIALEAHTALLDVLGSITVGFVHRGAASVNLTARLVEQSVRSVLKGGTVSAERTLVIKVALQTGFAVPTDESEPVTPGDLITYLGRTWVVQEPVTPDPANEVYTLVCVESKALGGGAKRG
jgi:hypothetical protein